MAVLSLVFLLSIAAVTALPPEREVSRLDFGLRFRDVPVDVASRRADARLADDGTAQAPRYAPDVDNVYHMFSRQNPTQSEPMLFGWEQLIAPNFRPDRPSVVIIHGWASGPTSNIVTTLVPNILAAVDANVIVVDWSAGAYEPNYYAVVANNVPVGGESIGRFISWLNIATGSSLSGYHIIGFEAGAHIAGLAGRTLGGQVPYITALEPPRPGFFLNPNAFRSTDAIYTECIHTNAGVTGLAHQVADVDFFPNQGTVMAGCEWTDWECSRDRAFAYFAESIIIGGFTGVRCESVAEALTGACESQDTLRMGGLVAKNGSSGIYYLTTNEQAPYSIG